MWLLAFGDDKTSYCSLQLLGLLQGSQGRGWSGSTALLKGNGKLPCNSARDATTEMSHRNSVAAAKVL